MKTEEISKLKSYFSKQPVELVYLFGSMAKGLGKAYSDIDFAILFKKELSGQKRFDLKLKIIGDLCFILKTDSIDVVDLKDASPFLKFEAMKPRYEIFILEFSEIFTTKEILDELEDMHKKKMREK